MNIKSAVLSALLLSGIALGFAPVAEAGGKFSPHACMQGDYHHPHGGSHFYPHHGYRYQHQDYSHHYRHDGGHHYGQYRKPEHGKYPASHDSHGRQYGDDHRRPHEQAGHEERRHGYS